MYNILRQLLITSLLQLIGLYAFCQDFPTLHYTTADGLPSNTVYSVYRDRKGFLWFSTDKGIAKYNGLRFEVFTTYDGLPDNEIFSCKEDPLGRLWLATYNGELCYYKDGVFHTAKNTPFLKLKFKKSYINSVVIEQDSSVTFRFYNSYIYINIKDKNITNLKLDSKKLDSYKHNLITVKKKSPSAYKIFYSDSVLIVDTSYNIIDRFQKQSAGEGWKMYGNQHIAYMYSEDYVANDELEVLKQLPKHIYDKHFVYQVYQNSTGWFVSTNHGIILNDSITLLKEYKVSCLTQDKENNYWATTLDNGVFVIDKNLKQTKLYKNVYSGSVVYATALGKELFFIGDDNTVYTASDGTINVLINYSAKLQLQEKNVKKQAFVIDSCYHFFSWSNEGFLSIDHLKAPHPVIRKTPNILKSSESVKSIINIGLEMYINTRQRLLRLEPGAISHKKQTQVTVLSDQTIDDRIFGMSAGPSKTLWFSTITHMYEVKDGLRTIRHEFDNLALKTFHFYGKTLVGYTYDNKLIVCSDPNNHAPMEVLPPQRCVWGELYQLDNTHVLISTSNMYRLLTINANSVGTNYSITPIENPAIPLQAESICSDGEKCYFFKNGNITLVSINGLLEQPKPPQLFFNILTDRTNKHKINESLSLSYYDSKNITVSFSTLSFSSREVWYEYSFTSNEQDSWRNVNGEEINLVNPGFGTYTLKLRAKTLTSGFCEPIAFTLIIARPYWASWWFLFLAVLGSLTIIGLIIRVRILRALRRKEEIHKGEIKFMKSEYKALNALMNPHFIFNTLNNVQGLINLNDKLAANQYLRIFANLVRQNMHNISQELIPLQKEIDVVENYLKLEQLRFKELINYEINVESNIDISEIMIPPLLIQPLVENSIKHGILPRKTDKGLICISVFMESDKLVIAVKDNGIGIEAARKRADKLHESTGLNNIRKRIAQLGVIQNKEIDLYISDMHDEAGVLQWTIVSVCMSV